VVCYWFGSFLCIIGV